MAEKFYTVEDVARILQISVSTVRKLINDGDLRSIRIGKQIRVPESALNEYIERQSGR